ncbi:hypothetical protein [Microbacterium album]|uniref:Uncharacterized protein n=1 Tax=Microbacterium album TaxID=2053191 RepID=A0A917IGT8_9MICO|nr:hypothetical protein [Microbacterium album]GGH50711.1 hypothetical protein GCM10010921_29640 [Microbacterium album]
MDTFHQLELVPLGDGAWRVCDRSVAACDAASVIAYVEQIARDEPDELSYEAVWVSGTRGTTRHGSIESVLLLAADVLAACASTGPRRPKQIAHFQPARPVTPERRVAAAGAG